MRFLCVRTGLVLLVTTLQIFAYSKSTTVVEMRDGIKLSTDIYQPDTDNAPWPTILIRTPYNKDGVDPSVTEVVDVHNYALVIQNTRGRFDSEGVDSVFLDDAWGEEKRDGYDCIEWIAEQSWCDGNIGTWGGSANGITQYYAAGSAPPHLKCQFVMVAVPSLFHYAIFPGGEFRKYDIENWLAGQGSTYMLSMFEEFPTYDTNWMRVNLAERWDSVKVPAYHVGGWYDLFLEGTLDAFYGYQYLGGEGAKGHQKLLIGPWTHGVGGISAGELTYPSNARVDLTQEAIRWFDFWLKGEDNGIVEEPPVRYYQMGDPVSGVTDDENTWITAQDWPVATEPMNLYLRSDGTLDSLPPTSQSSFLDYQYDPDNPVQTVGGRNLVLPAGPRNQWIEGLRDDLLLFTSPVLIEPVIVTGKIVAHLYASSDRTDTDWSVRISDIYPDGRIMLVADGMLKSRFRNSPDLATEELMEPGSIYQFDVDLWSTAMTFAPGHRIRVSVTSSNYQRFEVNPNTGGPFQRNDPATQIATNRIYCNANYPSCVSLPIPADDPVSITEPTPSSPVTPVAHPSSPPSSHFPAICHLEIVNTPSTNHQLKYMLFEPGRVTVRLFNSCGRVIETIEPGFLPAGEYSLNLSPLSDGVFFIQLISGNSSSTCKLVVIN